jgi:hypothetical protein
MKTTLEMPDAIFRRAKAVAAEEGIPLRQFVSRAVENELRHPPEARRRRLLKLAGGLRHLKGERARMNRIVEQEFERIDPEMWK